MTTIKINISDDLANKVFNLTNNAEKYIIDLLKSKVNEDSKPLLTLDEEYKLAKKENSKIQKDFKCIDLENWEDEY